MFNFRFNFQIAFPPLASPISPKNKVHTAHGAGGEHPWPQERKGQEKGKTHEEQPAVARIAAPAQTTIAGTRNRADVSERSLHKGEDVTARRLRRRYCAAVLAPCRFLRPTRVVYAHVAIAHLHRWNERLIGRIDIHRRCVVHLQARI